MKIYKNLTLLSEQQDNNIWECKVASCMYKVQDVSIMLMHLWNSHDPLQTSGCFILPGKIVREKTHD